MEVQKVLEAQDLSVRICSIPCFSTLLRQGKNYLHELQGNAKDLVAIETASSFGWSSIIGLEGIFFGLDTFGASAPAEKLYEHYGLNSSIISQKLLSHKKT